MKRFSKKAFAVLIVTFCFLLISGFSSVSNTNAVDVQNIYNSIKELSSKEYNGRMAGSEEGIKTENYVAGKFKEIGLTPCGEKNTYFQTFKGISGNPGPGFALEVMDGERVVRKYSYGSDYKYMMAQAYEGEAISMGIRVDLASGSLPKVNGEIALLDVNPLQGSKPKQFIDFYNAGYGGIITCSSTPISRRKGQSGIFDSSDACKLPRVTVSKSAYDELVNFSGQGLKIHLKASYIVKRYSARNVLGLLKPHGHSDQYLIISAHMDHLGPDPDGAYFPGALDNASGVSSIIEIARALKSMPNRPDINIVFIAFSGEEEMLHGSTYYVQNPVFPLKNTKVINLDMVGAKSNLPVSIINSDTGKRYTSDTQLIDEFCKMAIGLSYVYQTESNPGSDHNPFGQMGVPAVTIIDEEKEVYHVPEDNIENIGIDNLKRDISIVMEVIRKEAYSSPQAQSIGIQIYFIYGIPSAAIIIAIIYLYRKSRLPK